MSHYPRTFSLLCAVCVAAFACDGAARDPVAPNAASLGADPAVSLADAGYPLDRRAEGETGGQAMTSGHLLVHGTTVQGVKDETKSFAAISHGNSLAATGELVEHHLKFDGTVVVLYARVTCLSVVDNQAWVGTRLTRAVVNGEEVSVEGIFPIFRVLDAGRNDGPPDRASLVFLATKGTIARGFVDDMSYCELRPNFPILFESAKGHVKVKPGVN